MIDFSGLFEGREWWLGTLVGLSVVMFLGSLIAVPWLIVRLPADYFSKTERHSWTSATGHPLLHWLGLLAKNSLGLILLVAGITMLVLPGQGVLTMVMGLVLLDFPGKYRFERYVVSPRSPQATELASKTSGATTAEVVESRRRFAKMSAEYLVISTAIGSALLSWITLFFVRRFADRIGLVDKPGHRKVHTVPTPLGGGIGIWFGVLGVFGLGSLVVLLARQNPNISSLLPSSIVTHLDGLWFRVGQLWVLLAAASVMAVLGLIDDIRGLPWYFRLGFQFAVAAATVYVLGYRLTAFIPYPWMTQGLSVLWIVAMINSFNMLDNMDGLSGGVAAIICGVLGLIMLTTPDPGTGQSQLFVAALLFVLCGGLLGFLYHNRPPAKIFMGDAGSYFVGFLVAVSTLLATYAGYQETRPHAVLAPLCVMAVPLYDMSTVLWIRMREGRSLFEGDKSHFSHRLVDLGLSKPGAVLTIYLVTLVCGLAGVLVGRVDIWSAFLVLGIVLCMLGLIAILESTGWRRDGS